MVGLTPNYTIYNIINNKDNIAIIYVDKTPCIDNQIDSVTPENIPYYVEIHHTPSSNIPKFETILKNYEIDTLINKYGCKV